MGKVITNDEVGALDVPTKPRGWHTALYYFAEHIRILSHGRINHKALYSYVGINGHYINHGNPTIRKRTAAMLSRLVHSKRYIEDFRQSYSKNSFVFDEAAQKLCADLSQGDKARNSDLIDYFLHKLWRDVERGLRNEREEGRADLNLARVANEMHSLFSWCAATSKDESEDCLRTLISSYFHLLTFGHLDEALVCSLVDETPLVRPNGLTECGDSGQCSWDKYACLVKFPKANRGVVSNWWVVDANKPFTIGRYTDCDAIETNRFVSRLHCRIVCKEGRWYLEDMGSQHGSCVLRGDEEGVLVYSSAGNADELFELERNDRIVLSETSYYWFGAFEERRKTMREGWK